MRISYHNPARIPGRSPVETRLRALFAAGLLVAACVGGARTTAEETAASKPSAREASHAPTEAVSVFRKDAPETIADLLAMEATFKELAEKVTRPTVAVSIGRAQGSGVIVSDDGYVLTAAHVSQVPGRTVWLTLSDGRRVAGKTLGVHHGLDAGLLKITSKAKWPHAEMADSHTLRPGDWCIAAGHPAGYHEGRAPVIRLGRVLSTRSTVLQSDCTLVGGDSGGPLFDMQGRVIGVHSRIGAPTTWNFHVPIASYSENWERLVSADAWGGPPVVAEAVLGVRGEDHPRGCRITHVAGGHAAQKAGLQIDDVIVTFDGKQIDGFNELAERVRGKLPGETLRLTVLRGDKTLNFEVVLGRRK